MKIDALMKMDLEYIKGFEPKSKFFVGIDSDGTVFDSMNPKHFDAFIPAAKEIWGFGGHESDFETVWNKVNLYSKTRGVNRFAALDMVLKRFSDRFVPEKYDEHLSLFIGSGHALSEKSLVEFNKEINSPFLYEVIKWSKLSDELFEQCENRKDLFEGIKDIIQAMSQKADIMIVSAAASKGLYSDWNEAGLMDFVSMGAGQDLGGKDKQLAFACHKYPVGHTILLGDAPGDYEAAQKNNALFFPIIPGSENASWKRFIEEGFDRFLAETYSGEYQDKLITEFLDFLED